MKKQSPLPETADQLELRFYEALQQADIERLMACWADDEALVCVHPGGPRLIGAQAIRSTFEAMFANGPVMAQPQKVRSFEHGNCSVHSVVERVEVMGNDGPVVAWVLATNVFLQTAAGWRLVAHHASPGQRQEPVEVSSAPTLLH